jgi:hypothetical protein
VNREEMYGAEATLGLPLEEFIVVAIEGLQQVAPEIGLQGPAHQSGDPCEVISPDGGWRTATTQSG